MLTEFAALSLEGLLASLETTQPFRRLSWQPGLLRIASECAVALSYLHENGVMHGCLHPSNIRITVLCLSIASCHVWLPFFTSGVVRSVGEVIHLNLNFTSSQLHVPTLFVIFFFHSPPRPP